MTNAVFRAPFDTQECFDAVHTIFIRSSQNILWWLWLKYQKIVLKATAMLRINLQTELCNELNPPSIFLLLLPSYFLTSSICHRFLLSSSPPSLPSFHHPFFSSNIFLYPYLSSFLPSNLDFTPFLTSSLFPSQYSFQFTSFFSTLDLFLSIGMRESSTHCSEYL